MGELIEPSNFEYYLKNNFVNVNGDAPNHESLFSVLDDFYSNLSKNMPSAEWVSNRIIEHCNVLAPYNIGMYYRK